MKQLKKMLKINIIFAVISLFFVQTSNAQPFDSRSGSDGYAVIDRVVAKVGDNIILHSDIEIQKLQAMEQGYQLGPDADCRILEEMLYQNLLAHRAKIDSLEINDAQVEAELDQRIRMMEGQVGGRKNLEKVYNKSIREIKDEFRGILKDRLLAEMMEEEITRGVRITPREVRRFFEEIPTDSLPTVNEQVALQQIVVFPKVSQRAKDATITQLRRWKTDIERGTKSFEAVAAAHSDDPRSKKQGGLIEASRGMMVKPFEAAAFSLQVGEISDVVETQFGFHIIQLVDRRGDDYTIRHVLKVPEPDRSATSQAIAVIEEAVGRVEEGEITWNQAIKEYSEDEMTRQNLGNIINPYTGDLLWDMEALKQVDPQVHAALQRMEIGMISEPMVYEDAQKRKEGVRVIRLRDKTPAHTANLVDDFTVLKRAAENRKKEEVIEKWVKEMSAKTYVMMDNKFNTCRFLYNW